MLAPLSNYKREIHSNWTTQTALHVIARVWCRPLCVPSVRTPMIRMLYSGITRINSHVHPRRRLFKSCGQCSRFRIQRRIQMSIIALTWIRRGSIQQSRCAQVFQAVSRWRRNRFLNGGRKSRDRDGPLPGRVERWRCIDFSKSSRRLPRPQG